MPFADGMAKRVTSGRGGSTFTTLAPRSSNVRAQSGPASTREKSTTLMPVRGRSEEHTSELQSLMRISYAVFCLKKKKKDTKTHYRQRQYIITNRRRRTSRLQLNTHN